MIRRSVFALVLFAWLGVPALSQAKQEEFFIYASRLPLEGGDDGVTKALNSAAVGTKINFYCAKNQESLAFTARSIPSASACTDLRLLASSGSKLTVTYVDAKVTDAQACSPEPTEDWQAELTEHARKTALANDFTALLKTVVGAQVAEAGGPKLLDKKTTSLLVCLYPKTFTLQKDRALADLSVTIGKPPSNKGAGTDADITAKTQLITGPSEHWFLSADATVTGPSQLKYDPATRQLTTKDKPEQLYLGVNLLKGDLFKKYPAWSTERLALKFMLTPSRKPFDSFGVGVGYRFAEGPSLLGTTDAEPTGGFVIFVGSFWTTGDQLDAAGAAQTGGRKQSWRLGLSYSLDTLLATFK